jgi:hypothetical protein
MSVYTAEETDNGVWSIIDEHYIPTGARVLDAQSEEAAEFYAKMMTLVYDRVMQDVKELTK